MKAKDEIRVLLKRLDGEPADQIESEDIEFKPWNDDTKSLIRELREYTVCFANAQGGTIVFGIRDKCRSRQDAIAGVGQYDLDELRKSIYDGTAPPILVEIEEMVEPEGKLLLVHVPRGLPPHTTTEGVGKIRVGKECKPLIGPELVRLAARGGQQDPTSEAMANVAESNLDREAITELRDIISRKKGKDHELLNLGDRNLLTALDLWTQEGMTKAAILLVGNKESIAKYAPQHEVIFLTFKSATQYEQRLDLRGPILLILRKIEELIQVHGKIHTITVGARYKKASNAAIGFEQREVPDISSYVARESVLNSLMHRDYFLRQSVTVSLYRDRLEVTSPGGFFGGVTPDNILNHPAKHRNRLLSDVFHKIGDVERIGVGVDRIFDDVLRNGKDLPRYASDESYVRLTIPLTFHNDFAAFVASEEKNGLRLELDDLLILRSLVNRPAVDRWTAAQILQKSETDAAEQLVRLRELGYLIVRGRGRGTAYDLRRDLAEKFRGQSALDSEITLNEEGIRLRILALLNQRGKLTNAEIRRFSGLGRVQVYRLLKSLQDEGKIRFAGLGRGAHIVKK